MLQINKISKTFGGLRAVNQVEMEIKPKEIIGMIGPNGAGKTTLVNLISGFHSSDSGSIFLDGKDITNTGGAFVSRQGIARTFQVEKSFRDLSVLDNVTIGALVRSKNIKEAIEKAETIAKKFKLDKQKNVLACHLTIQSRKLLEFARAYATKPKLIILDEAMAGLTPLEIDGQLELIREIASEGVSFLIIEHIMQVIMAVSQRIIVLQEGAKIADDTPEKIGQDPMVIQAYLGKGE